jgi:hypothetical protein
MRQKRSSDGSGLLHEKSTTDARHKLPGSRSGKFAEASRTTAARSILKLFTRFFTTDLL